MMADSTDANNLEQNKVIVYRITSKHTWRKTWAGNKRDRTKPGNANKSSNDERITQHEPSSASPPEPSLDLRTELKDTKVPKNGCWARRADVNVLFTQWKPSQ